MSKSNVVKFARVLYANKDSCLQVLAEQIKSGSADVQDDGSGQLIVYSGVFEWADGKIRDIPEEAEGKDVS